jgi:hypothetical protein
MGRGYLASNTVFIPDVERYIFREDDAVFSAELLNEKRARGGRVRSKGTAAGCSYTTARAKRVAS